MNSRAPLVAHIIHRLQVGGLENGLVNLINNTPPGRYRHMIVCMTDYTDFRKRLRSDVPCYALYKREGQDFRVYWRLWKLLRTHKPDILHTRNIGTLECVVPASLAGVSHRVHGEHGRDMSDIDGGNKRYRLMRRALNPWVGRFIALSRDLEHWLIDAVGIPRDKIVQLYNGVDTRRFHPPGASGCPQPDDFFDGSEDRVFIGTVGRMQGEKDPLNLVRAFINLVRRSDACAKRLRLVMVGDGPLRTKARRELDDAGMGSIAWLPGDRSDVPDILRALDIFVLPSLGEGISNTILEAMASGLPVVATAVGGNPELVSSGTTGSIVPPGDPEALSSAIGKYVDDQALRLAHGLAGRERVESTFSLETMVERYLAVYDRELGRQGEIR